MSMFDPTVVQEAINLLKAARSCASGAQYNSLPDVMSKLIQGALARIDPCAHKAIEPGIELPVYVGGSVTSHSNMREAIVVEMASWVNNTMQNVFVLDPAAIDPDRTHDDSYVIAHNKGMIERANVVVLVPTAERPCPGTWMEAMYALQAGKPVFVLWNGRKHTWFNQPGISVMDNLVEFLDVVYRAVLRCDAKNEVKARWSSLPQVEKVAY